MAKIVNSIEIARRPEDVFAYLDDLARHDEWQDQIVSSKLVTPGPTQVGSRATDVRRMPGGKDQAVTYEITEHDPPRRASFRGVDGPVRPVGTVSVIPLDASRSRVMLELDFEGRGIGKLLLPLVRRDAAKHVPADQQRLKERLEAGA